VVPLAPDDPWSASLHARSRFQHLDDRERFALYSIRDASALDREPTGTGPVEDHTLVTVREFRRVPLDASGLRLVLFTARPGRAAQVIAALAHWVERAVSIYQPTYVLLAHSLEQPRLTALVAGVRERRALQWAQSTPFSVDVLPELAPLLEHEPDHFAYCPEARLDDSPDLATQAVSPFAV
jgi:hypothetical protein